MKKSCLKRFLINSIVVVLLFLLGVSFFSCRKSPNEDIQESSSEVSTNIEDSIQENPNKGMKISLVSGGNAVYNIVKPENCSSELSASVNTLAKVLMDETDVYFRQIGDAGNVGKPIDGAKEIIIGNCDRTDTKNVLETIKYKDFKICVTENNIVVAAYEDSMAVKGVQKFIRMIEGNFSNTENESILTWEGDYYYKAASYRIPQITLNGVSLKDYTIVYSANDTMGENISKRLQGVIGTISGDVLEIASDNHTAGKYEILLGNTNRSSSTINALNLEPLEYVLSVHNEKIIIAGSQTYSTIEAIEAFRNYIINNGKGILDGINIRHSLMENETFAAKQGDIRIMEYNVLVEYPGWGSGYKIPAEVEIRKEIVSNVINGYMPDVICMCEFFENWRNQLPPLLDSSYKFVAIDRPDGLSNRSTLAYNSDTLTLIEGGYDDSIALSEDINKRTVMWAVFQVKTSGERFMVLGSHFTSERELENIRVKQAQIMISIMNELKKKYDVPAIITGDFNTLKGDAGYQAIIDGTGFKSALETESAKVFDHIFYDSNLLELKLSLLEKGKHTEMASDHSPILADLKIK